MSKAIYLLIGAAAIGAICWASGMFDSNDKAPKEDSAITSTAPEQSAAPVDQASVETPKEENKEANKEANKEESKEISKEESKEVSKEEKKS